MDKKKAKGKKIILVVLLILIVSFVAIIIAALNTDESDTNSDADSSYNSGSKVEKEIYSDENFKVSYIGLEDPQSGVTAYNLVLKIENDSDKEVVASLTDGYANDTAIDFYTGLPVEIKPQKNAVGAYVFGYANLGIDSIDDIETLEFKVTLYDSDFSEKVLETEDIKLAF